MSPKEAKVFVAEYDPKWHDIIRDELKREGHNVVLAAHSRSEALAAVKKLQELGITVATIDGNLNSFESNGNDGQAILAAIRSQAPEVKTVGMGGNEVAGVDVNVGKDEIGKLGKVINRL